MQAQLAASPLRRLFPFRISLRGAEPVVGRRIQVLDDTLDVLFEESPPLQPGVIYPQCLEGARACPPEDVGGIDGYTEHLEAIADPSHERHQELVNWRGPFNPNTFNARLTKHVMQEGMPDWRQMD